VDRKVEKHGLVEGPRVRWIESIYKISYYLYSQTAVTHCDIFKDSTTMK
jgi:hypothetical protein